MSPQIAQAFTYVLAMMVCLSFHEWAHAWAAQKQGDLTAKSMGRLTLNPIAHADPVGTFLLPALGAIFGFPVLGWAKPVPVNPRNFSNRKYGELIVAAAGPVSNLIFCAICIFLQWLYIRHGTELIPENSVLFPLVKLVSAMVWMNAILAVFNLIPLPPLDGATVLGGFLPRKWAEFYASSVAPYGFVILLVLMFSGALIWVQVFASKYVDFVQNLFAHIS